MMHSKEMVRTAYHALDEKKGEDIRIIDISSISIIADYFVIVNGTSGSQVHAMVDYVEEKMAKAGYTLKQREGSGQSIWTLLDYSDIIVHIFDQENRSFYNLERIWGDGKEIKIEEL